MGTTGKCLCGAVTYEYEGDPIATAVCHCDHCQRQSGGAFSVNVMMMANQLTVTGELTTYEDRGDDGDAVYVYRRFCPSCGSPIISQLVEPEGLTAVKAGTLDDVSGVQPAVQVWCERKQPWVDIQGVMALDRES